MYRKNSNYSKNNKFKLQTVANFSSQIFVAILAKICLIEIACRKKRILQKSQK